MTSNDMDFDPETIMGNFSSKKKKRFVNSDDESVGTSLSSTVETPFDTDSSSGLKYKQRKAVQLLGALNYTEEEVAAELNITVSKIKRWKKKQSFMNALYALERQLSVDSIEKRKLLNNQVVGNIHDTLMNKIANGDLNKYSVQQLVDLLSKVSGESRLDDKNTLPKKVIEQHEGTITFGEIQQRWNETRNRELVQHKLEDDFESDKTVQVVKEHRLKKKI